MDSGDEWGSWIEHDGKGCPLPLGTMVQCIHEGPVGSFVEDEPGPVSGSPCWDWHCFGAWVNFGGENGLCSRIVRYRVRTPRGLRQLRALIADPVRHAPELEDA